MLSLTIMNTLKITSTQNPKVKDVIALRKKSTRDETGLFLIEGAREILHAIENQWTIKTLFFCQDYFQSELEQATYQCGIASNASLIDCSTTVFDKIAYRDRPDGLLAVAEKATLTLNRVVPKDNAFIIIAESVEKPGNLGSILRTADAAGVDLVILSDPTTDLYNPNVVRSSIGTLFTVPVVQATNEDVWQWITEHHITTLAATPDTDTLYTDIDMINSLALLVGTEQKGLSPFWLEKADQKVRIPMLGKANSLNVSASTAILLYEAVRQRTIRTISNP